MEAMSSRRRRYVWFYDHVHSRYYGRAMKWFFLPFGGEKKVRRTLLEKIDLHAGDRVLDMCCGTGNVSFLLAELLGEGASITGIDISRGMIERAKRRNRYSNVKFLLMDAENTSFPTAAFDKVIIPHALHEMFHDARIRVLKEARRVLVEHGKLGVFELSRPRGFFNRSFAFLWFLYWLPFNFETPTRRDMFRHGLMKEMRSAGFRNVIKESLYRGMLQVVQGEK
jgi:demethylmenaquinone methyltransferase/2-methoxy-6-polyprenyl-1,4-benzoquinol methylase